MVEKFQVGDLVVFAKNKRSSAPGPRATNVKASRTGEQYSYQVEKYWIVARVDDHRLFLQTRRGKIHTVDPSDIRLRKARWWERAFMRSRFPKLNREMLEQELQSQET